ncbi:coenzyme F420-0:L-glutamate ligase [Humibacter ginsengisoli]
MTAAVLTAWPVPGIREIVPGDDLAALVGDALEADARERPERALQPGDILVVTSKVVSKAEGRVVAAQDREDAITAETVRVVATRAYDGGLTRIVENRQGVVGAAAGVDASNAPDGVVLLLPEDPDASAQALRDAWSARFGVQLGVIVSDTLGRTWRIGQTDVAIGAAGVRVVDDLRGQTDASGKPLAVTQPAVGDELAALGDLVKGKASGCPVAVVRGASRLVVDGEAPFTTGRSLARTGPGDMFRLGTDEALAEGYRRGLATGLAIAAGAEPRWTVVIPFKGGDSAKSRFADAAGIDRRQLSVAFLTDTIRAVRSAGYPDRVLVVTADSRLCDVLGDLADCVIPDPGTGLNSAVTAGVSAAYERWPSSFVAVLVGDLPALRADDLDEALRLAVDAAKGGHPYAFVPDHDGTGTTAITAAPGAAVSSRFGIDSRLRHAEAGYHELAVPQGSTLRLDIDDASALNEARDRLGEATRELVG